MDSDDDVKIVKFELINIRGPKDPMRQLLTLVATFKGHSPRIADGEKLELEERQPHGALRIEGFWPAVEYLNDRYPYPPIYLGNVIQDSMIRSIVASLSTDTDNVLGTLKAGASQSRERFFIGSMPTLLDLAAVSYADLTDDFWIERFNRVAAYIRKEQAA